MAIPIAIHLLNKFRVKTVDWGAMRFLRESLRRNERRVKVEDLILLIARCLLVAVLVAAFARPVLRGFAATGSAGGPVAAMVLLDSSASMSQSNGSATRFEDGKRAILEWLTACEPRSLVGLCLVSNRTEALVPAPQPDLGLVRKSLELARPTNRGTDLAQGIRLAFQTLKNVSGRREIRVYTDDQTCAWSKLEEIRQLARDNSDIALRPIVLGRQGEDNVGIIALRPEGGVPAARQPYRVQVEIGNYGQQPVTGLHVALSIDGGTPVSDTPVPSLASGATHFASLVVSLPDPGPHTITATIPSDAFQADNQRTLAVEVVRRMEILLVDGAPSESAMDSDTFFLANALLPFSQEEAARSYLEMKTITLDHLDAAALAGPSVVFLSDPGAVTDAAARSLAAFVQAGGNLVVFPGPRTPPTSAGGRTAWSDLLPATLLPMRDAPDPSHPLAWQSSDFEHPVTALWNDPAQGSLGSVKTARFFPLDPKPSSEKAKTAVMVRYANGEPAAVEWPHGEGRVVLFGSTATPEWNNLVLHPAFVPLMQRLLGYLNRKNEARLALTPGDLFIKEMPPEWAGKDFTVQRPGTGASAQPGGQITTDGGRAYLRYADTEALGTYRMFVGGQLSAVCSVALDPAESDLRQLDKSRLATLDVPPPAAGASAPAARLVVTRDFWAGFIWAGLLLALVECVLAHRFSHAR